jgi:tetratricopeptide (TPR) repeat protein
MPLETAPVRPGKFHRDRARRWMFRCSAIVLGLLPFVLAELVLRGLGLPAQPPAVDPYVDLHNLRPLFQFNPGVDRWEISPDRMNLFRPASFARLKPERGFRVFALGGSTTQGEPYGTETAFPEWLKLNLQAAVGETRQVEVINCGGLSYASYRVLAILREVLAYEPDLIVIYTGQNEYLEYRSYEGYRQSSIVQHLWSAAASLRTVQFCRSWAGLVAQRTSAGRSTEQRPLELTSQTKTELQAEVDALLDYQGGLAAYERGADWYHPIPEHFQWNLTQMVQACQLARVPVILMRPVSNLLDCPPMKYQIDPRLPQVDQLRFEEHWAKAREAGIESGQAMHQLKQALAIDPGHAGAHYLLGQLQFAEGDYTAATISLRLAKDLDVCPLRAPTSICEIVTQVAQHYGLPLLEADSIFAERSPHGLVGKRWLVDHIHPNLEGHQLLGELLAEMCIEQQLVRVANPTWQEQRSQWVARHLTQINEAYFQRGKQRLEGLLLWTQGRAKKVKSAATENTQSDAPAAD